MEQFEVGYIRAVAAAAGCLSADFSFDDGIDLFLNHKADSHNFPQDKVARLEVQLKSTHTSDDGSDSVTSTMRRDRWEYFRTPVATIHKIVVIMSLPQSPEDWVTSGHESLSLHRCAYWVNLVDSPDSMAVRPTVQASKENIFDDVALCDIMERIGAGGKP
jgi:hypothetical protein